MKDQHHIGEVEEIFGIPRSRIQFYLKKAILDVNRDEDNGYRLFTRADLLQLKHLLIARGSLDLSLEESKNRIHAESLDEFHRLFYKQEQVLLERIAKDRRSLEVIGSFASMLARIEQNLDCISLVQTEPLHVFPERYAFDMRTSVIDIGYVSACFTHSEKAQLVFAGLRSVVHAKDSYLISAEDMQCREYALPAQSYVYTVIKTTTEMESPELLEPCIAWAGERGIALQEPFIVSYLFEIEQADTRYYYHELYLPAVSG